MSKNIQRLPTVELRQQLALYKSLQSRGVRDEIIITVMERELEVRNQIGRNDSNTENCNNPNG